MILSSWRIVLETHGADAFSGEGARIFGGRWNSPGTPVVYTASSRALAALEILVHLDSPRLLRRFVLCEAAFEDSLVQTYLSADLPSDWKSNPPPRSTQRIGDGWLTDAASPVLQVPSAIIPEEFNFLLNPAHPGFSAIRISVPRAFGFDPRLSRR